MSSKSNKSILGEDWFATFSLFRLKPDTFLDRRKLTKDAFCLDVLKDLYSDHVDIQNKIHLLLLLEEFSPQLITNINLLEQVVESLTNLYNVMGMKSGKRLLKCQILIATVTILLTLNVNQNVSNFIMKSKLFLLQIIYNTAEDSLVISSACSCLEELETFYPGLLQSEIENILVACERETSPAFQSYALLLNACSKQSSTVHKNHRESKELISVSTTDNFQMSPITSNVLELLPLLCHTAQYRVLKNLIFVVKRTSELSPKTFKLYLNNLAMSSEVPLFHLAFELQNSFCSDLFSNQEQKQLLKQLIKLSTHPCLTSSHRLLFLEWLKCFVKYNKNIFSTLHSSDLHPLLPSPFDGPLTQEKKLSILALCIPTDADESSCGNFLNEAASGLVKCSLLYGGTKAAPSLFRTLFTYFSSQKSRTVYDSIYKLLTRMMKTSLHLTPYALNFIDSAKSEHTDRNFHEKALDHMVEHILSVPVKQFHANLDCYLIILERAAQESSSTCKPRAVLRLLQKLFNDINISLEKNWCTGNSILFLCRSLIKHHDVQIFYYDLAEVLCLITQQFKDTDVKDRAKIYYSMLTSLSKFKVQAIFDLHSSEKEGTSTLNSFVTSNESSQFASCIQKLSKPVLQMLRSTNQISGSDNKCFEEVTKPIHDILKTYFHHLKTHQSFLQIPFTLKHVSDIEKCFFELYSIVITTHSEPACQEITDIEIPILNKSREAGNQGKTVLVNLKPEVPQPLTLHFKMEFTCSNGLSYACQLPSVILNLKDLFLPLPVPEIYSQTTLSWRKILFETLWEDFIKRINLREENLKCCQSAFALKIRNEDFHVFVEKKWQQFIVSRLSSSYHIAIHLPPKYHLLLKICIMNNEPFVNILVDDNSILPWVTLYLQSLCDNDELEI